MVDTLSRCYVPFIKGAQVRLSSSLAPVKSGVRARDLETGAGRGGPLEKGKD